MLSDSDKFKKRRSPRSRAVGAPTNKHWSDSQKIECVKTYLMLGGNGALTIATLKIPEQTFYQWKRTEWWHDLEQEIRKEERLELSAKLKKILTNSSHVVADRLENGDWFYDQKTGELRRKPVLMKDAAKVMNDAAVLQTKLNVTETINMSSEAVDAKLAKLAQAFEDLSQKKKRPEVIDLEDIEFEEVESSEGDETDGFSDSRDPDDWDEDPGQGDSGPPG